MGFVFSDFGAGCYLGVEFDLEVVLRKFVEPHPSCLRIAGVDPDPQPKTICFKCCVVFRRKVFDQTHYEWRLF